MLARLSYTIACLIWELWLYDLNLCSENRKWGTLQLRGQKDFTQIMSALLIILTERECPTFSILKTPKVFPKKRPPKVSSPASGKLLLPKIGITGMFIPRREVRTHSPDGVHLTVFPIYMPLVNENWGFKNTNVNRPFSKCRKPLSPEGRCERTLPMGSTWLSFQFICHWWTKIEVSKTPT